MNKKDLGHKNKKELVKLARGMRISGISKLSKSELAAAVLLGLNKKAKKKPVLSKQNIEQVHECLDVQEEVEDSKYYTGSENEHAFYVEAAFTEKYEDNRVVLMLVSPSMIYAYWEVNTKTLQRLKRSRKKSARLMLRVSYLSISTQKELFFDIPTEGADNWYINTPESGCSYWVEIGTKNVKGVFSSIMTSNTLDVPRSDFSEVLKEVWTAEESVDSFEEEDFEEDVQETLTQAEEVLSQTLPVDPITSVAEHSDSQANGELSSEVAESDSCGREVYHVEPSYVESGQDILIRSEEVSEAAHKTLPADPEQEVEVNSSELEPIIQMPEAKEKNEVESVALGSVQRLKQADFAKKVYALSMGVRFDYEGETFITSGENAEVERGISSSELLGLAGIGSSELSSWVSSNIGGGEAEKLGRKFWYVLDAELIVYGATESDAHVTLYGEPIKLRGDGTFTVRFPLPNGVVDIPVVFESNDRVDRGVIETKVTRETEYR